PLTLGRRPLTLRLGPALALGRRPLGLGAPAGLGLGPVGGIVAVDRVAPLVVEHGAGAIAVGRRGADVFAFERCAGDERAAEQAGGEQDPDHGALPWIAPEAGRSARSGS